MRDASLQPLPATSLGVPGLLRLDYTSSRDGLRDWALLRHPAPGVRTWVICLHGFNANANQLFMRRDLKRLWLPRYLGHGFGILSPTLRGDAWMNQPAIDDLDDLIDYLRSLGATRLLIESGSMGATGALLYASVRPHSVQAVIARSAVHDLRAYRDFCRAHAHRHPLLQPIADSLDRAYGTSFPHLDSNALRTLPLLLAHGTDDPIMPISFPRQLIGLLHDHPRLRYCELPRGDHEAPLALQSPDLLQLALDLIL